MSSPENLSDPNRTLDQIPAPPPQPDTVDVSQPDHPTAETGPYLPTPPADAPTIPGYAILDEIAKGGMGRVFAGIDLSLSREVAIKTLLPGANTERFLTEAKITAKLPHPNIPPVHALGILDDGSPWLAMKLIRGETLAKLLANRRRESAGFQDLTRLVQIFEQIAQAVGFAHSRGVIHRDLKPLNVMVGEFGEVQVMDWGLAKDTSNPCSVNPGYTSKDFHNDHLQMTQAGAIMGTPGYMAPEQARGEAVDARADVFALGSTLAAILTDQPAFVGTTVRETIAKAAAAELTDVMGRLDSSGVESELVKIAKDCLQPSPDQRPPDAFAVAKLVADYRFGVEERLRKAETARTAALVQEGERRKRRRVLFGAGGAIVVALVLGMIGTSIGMLQANQARDREAQRARSESAAKQQAETRLLQVEKGVNLLGSIFKDLNPNEDEKDGKQIAILLGERLEQVSDDLDGNAIGDELAVARLQAILAQSQLGLGNYEKANILCEKAHATLATLLGENDDETLSVLSDLGTSFQFAGRPDKALFYFEEVLNRRKATQGDTHPDTLASLGNYAQGLLADNRFDKAIPLLEESLDQIRAQDPPNSVRSLTMMFNLGKALIQASQYDRAEAILMENLTLRESVLGANHPQTTRTVHQLAENYTKSGKFAQAIPLYEKALAAMRVEVGPKHPDTLICQGSLAGCYWQAGRRAEALPLFEENLAAQTERHGDRHRVVLTAKNNLGLAYLETMQIDKALPIIESTVEARRQTLSADDPELLKSINNHAQVLVVAGQVEKAKGILEELLETRRKVSGPEAPETLIVMNNLARTYYLTNAIDKALPLFEESLVGMRKVQPDQVTTHIAANNLGAMYRMAGKLDKSITTLEEAVANVKSTIGDDHPQALNIRMNLAKVYLAVGRIEDGLSLMEIVLAVANKVYGAESALFANMLAGVGPELLRSKQFAVATELLPEALRIQEQISPDAWSTFNTMTLLGEALLELGKPNEAEPFLTKGYEGLLQRADKIPPKDKSRISRSLELIIELYNALDQPDEIKKYTDLSQTASDETKE